jgi:hypothetical protein
MRQPLTPQVLYGLVDKYERLLRLRTVPTAVPPRDELRSLARQFPGALRELDRLPLERIEARLRAVQRVLAEAGEPEAWMQIQVSYHGYMRAALRVKRWARGWPVEPAAALLAFTAKYVPAADEPGLAPDVLDAPRASPRMKMAPDFRLRTSGSSVERDLGPEARSPEPIYRAGSGPEGNRHGAADAKCVKH